MENFFISGSTYIPTVDFNGETGVLEISGESYHEYTLEFFQPIFDWLEEYLRDGGKDITFNFRMTYFNTSSSRRFLEILSMLENYHKNYSDSDGADKGSVVVNWYYQDNDVDMLESGEEYKEDVDLTFNLIPCEDEEDKD